MGTLTTVFLAFGLAADAFAAAITSGIKIKSLRVNHALVIATFFGGFQAFMPLIGWLIGHSFKDLISEVDHWLAFGLLAFVGYRMIYESIHTEPTKKERDPLNIYILLTLSIATSIDALVIGISFGFLESYIATLVVVIGITTFILAFTGVFIGNKCGGLFSNKVEIAGGLILIGIGTKILVEHLSHSP
ncbi:Putative manganese efflux pump MntP [uncultured Synechococcales cyanobacterium]|uniref:Putative manganese efflux pump MntP n=1 Tax=uncultured Synechococcales cyanobacterium TaxID=1936017 RepID=A0A6N3IPJ6_9CYAN|nr:Putative manganese efflux pump MntP [uncultured Synechococcales cyanobacterium]